MKLIDEATVVLFYKTFSIVTKHSFICCCHAVGNLSKNVNVTTLMFLCLVI